MARVQAEENLDFRQPGWHPVARVLGRYFRIWARQVAQVDTAQLLPENTPTSDGDTIAPAPVYFVAAAELAVAAVTSGANGMVCLKPDAASDALASFLKGCGVAVWRQGHQEKSEISTTNLPEPGEAILLPVTSEAFASGAFTMAEALLFAARLKRGAVMLKVAASAGRVPWPGTQFAPFLAARDTRLLTSPAVQNLTTANARLTAAHLLSAPIFVPTDPPPTSPPSRPFALHLYAGAMRVLEPALVLYLTMRAKRGKEVWDRLAERRGIAAVTRPSGRLGWIHAASVGESVSILPLVARLLDEGYADTMLVTTGTATSAALMEIRLPKGALHQFVPLDVPRYAQAFLNTWQPDFALFAESEIWPNLMNSLAQRAIPHAILNGRMSLGSFKRWQRWPTVGRGALQSWSICLAQAGEFATRYAALGAQSVTHTGNLKFDAPPLPANADELDQLRRDLHGRPVWLAASTHPGEEEIVAQVHYTLRERCPELLTILVPRHPERTTAITRLLEDRWLTTSRRSQGGKISAKVDIYLADTVGELGLFFRLANIALVGGSLNADGGGHNPIEPAHLENAILHGPHVVNFRDMYKIFDAGGGALAVADVADLITQLDALLRDPQKTARMAAANQARIHANAGSLDRAVAALRPVIGSPKK